MSPVNVNEVGNIFFHFLFFSLFAVGGPITAAPQMHKFVVDQGQWISESQFSEAFSIGQAVPGPTVLFVAVLGWHLGMQVQDEELSGSLLFAIAMSIFCLLAVLLPSMLITMSISGVIHRVQDSLVAKCISRGVRPVVVGFILSTACLLVPYFNPDNAFSGDWSRSVGFWRLGRAWGLVVLGLIFCFQNKYSPIWVILFGAFVGWLGGL